jgi:hypothetical protein
MRILSIDDVAFEPGIDPLGSQTNGPSSSNMHMPQLVLFAGGVDRVATDTGVLRSLPHVQPEFHTNLPGTLREHRTESQLRWLVPADGSGPEGDSVVARRGRVRMLPSSDPQSIRSRSEESVEEGGAPLNAEVDAKSKISVGPRRLRRDSAGRFRGQQGRDLKVDVAPGAPP